MNLIANNFIAQPAHQPLQPAPTQRSRASPARFSTATAASPGGALIGTAGRSAARVVRLLIKVIQVIFALDMTFT